MLKELLGGSGVIDDAALAYGRAAREAQERPLSPRSLAYLSHMVTASTTYGCSLHHIYIEYGCSLHHMRSQESLRALEERRALHSETARLRAEMEAEAKAREVQAAKATKEMSEQAALQTQSLRLTPSLTKPKPKPKP